MTKVKVSVTGAGSLFGQGILKSVRDDPGSIYLEIQGLDYFCDAFGFRYCNTACVLPDILSEHVSEVEWYNELVAAVKGFQSKLLFIGADFELQILAKYSDDFFAQTGCKVVVSSKETIEICKDKLLFAKYLGAKEVNVPLTIIGDVSFAEAKKAVGCPFIVKPRFGARSRGVSLVNNELEFTFALNSCAEPIFQQFLPNPDAEYSCGIVVLNGTLQSVCTLKRILRDGNTWEAVSGNLEDPEFLLVEEYCRQIAKSLDFIGPANIQCRLVDGVPYAFEVNPRFSGTTYFRTLLGVNEPLNVIKAFIGLEVPTDLRLRPGKVRRYFSECLET